MAGNDQDRAGEVPDFDPERPPSTKEREVLESDVISMDPDADLFGTAPTMPGGEVPVEPSGRRGDRSGELVHGRYRLLRELGRGGMGTVYLAEHTKIRRHFAIKILNDRYLERSDIADRFLQEAQAVSLIDHPNVVSVTDFGRLDDGTTFLVMEHLVGESLAALCKREAPLPWARVRHMMLQICQALQTAHQVEVVHRDIKPENILRISREGDDDFIKVLDFGLAKLQGGGLRLTRTGMVIGTPEYMAPEQARGLSTDHRTDIYSTGIVMYELLCGVVPFRSKSFIGMRNHHLLTPPERPSMRTQLPEFAEEIDAIVLRALAKQPSHRFESMAAMAQAITDVGTGKEPLPLLERPTLQLDNFAERSRIDELRPAGKSTGKSTGPRHHDDKDDDDKDDKKHDGDHGSRFLWIGLAVGGEKKRVAIAGALVLRDHGTDPADQQPVQDPTQQEPQPAPTDHPVAETGEAGTERVVLRIVSNVRGPIEVVDESDASLGHTDDSGELVIPRGETPLKLRLRAPGHVELPLELVPDRDRSYALTFEALPASP
ncbi:MAG: serine/threonine protein kinase [Myxococcales bacterium]|nr:serine/threonine protein kinase [Myxococcales bacterium]